MEGTSNAYRTGIGTGDREPAEATALPGWVSAGSTSPCDGLVVRTTG